MRKILLLSLLAVTLLFLVVSCAPVAKEPQTPEEKLTEQMHRGGALAGQAISLGCRTLAVTNCRVADGRLLFTYSGRNYNYPAAWCSGTGALNAVAYNLRCASPTAYENCATRCTGQELCSNGVCAVPGAPGGACRAGGEPSLCPDQSTCLWAGFKWLDFDMDPDDAPRGCYASCPPGVVDSNGDNVCSLADNQFGCSANNMCESNNCDLARNTCVAVPPPEICDNLDNDRNGVVDNGCDDDDDNFCDSGMSKAVGIRVNICSQTPGSDDRGDDCNDNNVTVHPYAYDGFCDGIDQNCDGGDGYPRAGDYCNGRDENCDGAVDQQGGLSTCPTCADSDGGNNTLVGGFTSETWPAFPARNRVTYDSCGSTTRLNETVCVSNFGNPGSVGTTVSVDCSASGQQCISAAAGARCG